MVRRVCVFCGSSGGSAPVYLEQAARLGRLLAAAGHTIVYGGGSIGLMGALANAALKLRGDVIGVIPSFIDSFEQGHRGVRELRFVTGMHERKRVMEEEADAFVGLPGGVGSLDELMEVITLKRLDQHFKPILLVNLNGFYDPLLAMLGRIIDEGFMRPGHAEMWTVVPDVDGVLPVLDLAPPPGEDLPRYATL